MLLWLNTVNCESRWSEFHRIIDSHIKKGWKPLFHLVAYCCNCDWSRTTALDCWWSFSGWNFSYYMQSKFSGTGTILLNSEVYKAEGTGPQQPDTKLEIGWIIRAVPIALKQNSHSTSSDWLLKSTFCTTVERNCIYNDPLPSKSILAYIPSLRYKHQRMEKAHPWMTPNTYSVTKEVKS